MRTETEMIINAKTLLEAVRILVDTDDEIILPTVGPDAVYLASRVLEKTASMVIGVCAQPGSAERAKKAHKELATSYKTMEHKIEVAMAHKVDVAMARDASR